MTNHIDLFISDLTRHFEILDTEIADITAKINASYDPGGDGYYDRCEYFIGAGFVAAQKYILETFSILTAKSILEVKQETALSFGPMLIHDVSSVRAIWSAANYWKHDAQWWKGAIELGPPDCDGMQEVEISWRTANGSKHNVRILEKFGKFGRDYICSIVLAKFVNGSTLQLQSLLPHLEAWRKNMEREVNVSDKK